MKLKLIEIVKGSKKSENQTSTINSIKTLYKSREKAIELFEDYSILGLNLKLNTEQNVEKHQNINF